MPDASLLYFLEGQSPQVRSHARSAAECGFAPLHSAPWRTTSLSLSESLVRRI